MTWYLFITVLVFLPIFLESVANSYNRSMKQVSLFLICLILMFFMAARAPSVGIDTREYVRAFNQIKEFSFNDIFDKPIYGLGNYVLSLEYGYKLFNWLCAFISKNEQIIIIAQSVVVIVLLFILIDKKSEYPLLSIWMYLTLGIFQTEMNISRNAIALLIFYLSIDFIIERKPIRYFLCILIAMSFHLSAVFFIPMYFLLNYSSFNKKQIVRAVVISIVVTIAVPFIREALVYFVPLRYRRYILGNVTDFSSLLVGVAYFALFCFVYIFMDKANRIETIEEDRVGTWLFLINTICFILGTTIRNGARAAALFGPYIIIYLPNLIKNGVSEEKRSRVRLAVYIVCFILYIARMMVNNIGGTMPYSFAFG